MLVGMLDRFATRIFAWLVLLTRSSAATTVTGLVMFSIGLLQALSFLAALAIAHVSGVLPTMVFTDLPSNLLLAAVAFAPNLATA